MSDRVVTTMRVPIAGRRAVLEVEVVEQTPPRRWRLRVALWLIRLAGRVAQLRVRVAD